MSLVASSSTPHKPSPSLLAYPPGLAIVNCLLALIVLSSLLCRAVSVPVPKSCPLPNAVEFSRVPSRRAALKFKCGADLPFQNPCALRALHTLLPETRLTLQVQYCTIDPSPRDADSSGEGRVGAGCRYAS
jgi:hypothetical protein